MRGLFTIPHRTLFSIKFFDLPVEKYPSPWLLSEKAHEKFLENYLSDTPKNTAFRGFYMRGFCVGQNEILKNFENQVAKWTSRPTTS